MNTMMSIAVGLALVLAVGGLVFWQTMDTPQIAPPVQETPNEQNTNATSESEATVPATVFTAAEVAQHNTRASCWSSINGDVYDLTSWIPKHPGGEQAILRLCGTDGSAKFNGQHGGQAKQVAVLAGFKIGSLAQ